MIVFQLADVVLLDSDHLLTAVLKKFDYTTGINVYRSCKDLQELLDKQRLRWLLPGSTVSFDINKDDNQFIRKIMYSSRGQSRQKTLANQGDLEFLRVDAVSYVGHCPSSFLEKHIIPTMETLKGVKLFSIGSLEKEGLDVLFPTSGSKKLRNITDLEVILRDGAVQSLVSSRSRLFQLCKGPKTVRFMCAFGYSPSRKLELFKAFLEGWLAGEDVGRLERAVIPGGVASTRGAWINLKEIAMEYEVLAESVTQVGEEEYLFTRTPSNGKDQVILKKTGFGVVFEFVF